MMTALYENFFFLLSLSSSFCFDLDCLLLTSFSFAPTLPFTLLPVRSVSASLTIEMENLSHAPSLPFPSVPNAHTLCLDMDFSMLLTISFDFAIASSQAKCLPVLHCFRLSLPLSLQLKFVSSLVRSPSRYTFTFCALS